jgi:hypothetical protein
MAVRFVPRQRRLSIGRAPNGPDLGRVDPSLLRALVRCMALRSGAPPKRPATPGKAHAVRRLAGVAPGASYSTRVED